MDLPTPGKCSESIHDSGLARQSIRRIQTSPFIAYKDGVRGFIYEVETGRLREVA